MNVIVRYFVSFHLKEILQYIYPNIIMNKLKKELILNKKLNNKIYGKEEQTEGKER